ncbi:hypothetical protein P775_23280 [Puniceibacterium antarcticum]|uniref:Uncharacterized protein n=2 Tax=Puniceibacterium antarcticum TaxID=1206336 RepID=A0A2G8R887_9RHOB|nr:hypothetical protein P775_23280 [Puniceibacterium antarcticum]
MIGGNSPTIQQSIGWSSQRDKRPGLTAEAISVDNRSVTYESSDYRGWTTAVKRLQNVIGGTVQHLSDVVDVQAVDLNYTDRFIFEGDIGNADPSLILSADVLKLLAVDAARGAKLWHLHRGWFKTLYGKEYLINQNIDVQDAKSPAGAPVRSVQILSKAELRPDGSFEVSTLEDVLKTLHDECHNVFADCLSDYGRSMVGIEKREAI